MTRKIVVGRQIGHAHFSKLVQIAQTPSLQLIMFELQISSNMETIKSEILLGRRAILGAKCELDELSDRQSRYPDAFTSIPAFLADAALWNAHPIVVMLHKTTGLYGAALFHSRTVHGLPVGIATAGHKCGRGAMLASPAEQPRVAELSARALLRKFAAHTVMIRVPADLNTPLPGAIRASTVSGAWSRRDASSRLPLDGGMHGVMGRFSYKMRRNLRYYRRRADDDLGCVFVPQLSPLQTKHALEELSTRSSFPLKIATTLKYASELAKVTGHFAAGLQDCNGRWISFLAGYRRAGASYVTLQLNHAEPKTTSLMTVMRSYFLEHEIGLGLSDVIFVGGVNPSWARSCVPEICHELLAVRKGLQSAAVRTLGTLLRPSGLMAEVYGQPLEAATADA